MRLGIALVLALVATTARAEPVPIAVAPFAGRCFDAATLAERVRGHVDSPVTVGAPPRGSHQEVRVVERAGAVNVQVTARDARGAVVGSAHRTIPDDDCAAALEVAALIVARAALPLNAAAEPRAPVHKPKPPAPPKPEPEEPPPTEPPPPPKPQVIVIEKPVERRVPVPTPIPSGSYVLRLRGPERRWVGELSAAVYGAFALDGNGADEPAGELAVGARRGRLGLALRGDVEGDFTVAAPTASAIKLDIRRAQLALELHADVPVRVGAIRFVLGPTMPLWSVHPIGIAHPTTHVIASAGLSARLLYHLDIGRIFLTAGVTFDASLWREELTLTGVGPIAHTPLFEVGPILGFGANL
jgi:hypothetical protein